MTKHAIPRLAVALALAGCAPPPSAPDDARPVDAAAPPADLRPAFDLLPVTGPQHLSETGLYSDFAARQLAPGILHYVPRYPLWSDGAEKERYLYLPPGTRIETTADMDNWTFPAGTKAWKEFRRDGKLIETRLLQKVWDGAGLGGWWHVAYLWNETETDAVATPGGLDDARGTPHRVPSQEDCEKCHQNVADGLIGVGAIQLSADDGQGLLSQLAAMGLLSHPPGREFDVPGAGVTKAALGYVHGNCGHCHNERAFFVHDVNVHLRVYVGDDQPEYTGLYRTVGAKMYHVMPGVGNIAVTPGIPEKSQLYARMKQRDDWSMPPVCTKAVDPDGLATLGNWILSLPH